MSDATPPFRRAPEIVFQPPMVGVDQSGLSETMEFVLQYYTPEVQQRLVQVSYLPIKSGLAGGRQGYNSTAPII